MTQRHRPLRRQHMNEHNPLQDRDTKFVEECLAHRPETESVAGFLPGEGIYKLELKFDIKRLRQALETCVTRTGDLGSEWKQHGFGILPLTHRAGQNSLSANDLSGRYWMRKDERYVEEAFEDYVDESAYSEFDSRFAGTYFQEVHRELSQRFPIGRMRILSKDAYNCNSWHRDPEPRLHVPVMSNPGSLFIVNHHVTHLPADGSVYFTDTRGYHTAVNGGLDQRVHLVAALAYPPLTG
ncbi:MAG: hypothetical protein CL389_00745 [Acidiferrobacteraceae bacterium]|nr:hypothetical protein [Acidiferrobacteraceae bacterium]